MLYYEDPRHRSYVWPLNDIHGWIHNDSFVSILAMQLNLYLCLTFKHVLAASWKCSQDHEEVRDLIPSLHLDG